MKTLLMMLCSSAVMLMMTHGMGWCHGVEGAVGQITAHCITATYDDGEPLSYAAVEIKAPDSDVAFQIGRTDRNGCFMVNGDIPGVWQAVVTDGLGHRLALDFSVAADKEISPLAEKTTAQTIVHPGNRSWSVVAGLSMIIGLCGFFYGWKARRHSSHPALMVLHDGPGAAP